MSSYEYDWKKISVAVAVVVVVYLIYTTFIKESFAVRGADVKMAYAAPTASMMNDAAPKFTDGQATPSPATEGEHLPYTALDNKSVMQTSSNKIVSAATSKVSSIAPDAGTAVVPAVVGDGEPYFSVDILKL